MAERETLRASKREQKPKREPEPEARAGVFVLARSFGWVERGVSHFIPAGRELVAEKDAVMIAFLHRSGADIKAA